MPGLLAPIVHHIVDSVLYLLAYLGEVGRRGLAADVGRSRDYGLAELLAQTM